MRSPFGPKLLHGLAQLVFDLRSGEETDEGRVDDLVIRREHPQRLSRGATSK
jgi:hypothetical protein